MKSCKTLFFSGFICLMMYVSLPVSAGETSVSVTGAFGPGYGFGEGSMAAQDLLTETGSATAGVTAGELWRFDLAARRFLTDRYGIAANIALGTSAFTVVGYDTAGDPVEGRSFSVLSLDAAPLFFYEWPMGKDLVYIQAGPFIGLSLHGRVVIKSGGISSAYTVSWGELLPVSLGALVGAGYNLELGSGSLDMGLKVSYRIASVQGFVGDNVVPVHIITPYLFAGYSFRVKKHVSNE